MATEHLKERLPSSDSHKGTPWASTSGVWGPLCLLGVGLWTHENLWSHLGPLPLSLLLLILRLKRSEAVLVGGFLAPTDFILLAKVLQKPSGSQSEIKSLIVTVPLMKRKDLQSAHSAPEPPA